jgi:ribonuclease HII
MEHMKEKGWLFYESKYYNSGIKNICGIDEAGRGPLAGPVYAAAVILHKNQMIEGVNDSKKLSPEKREILYDIIIKDCLDYGIAFAKEEEIDEINIHKASCLAMVRAVCNLKIAPEFILVDGNFVPEFGIPAVSIIKGDNLSASIAAASILAKVSRDRFMISMSKKYPEYNFERHKGYGTKMHFNAIEKHGICEIHRKSFLKKYICVQK